MKIKRFTSNKKQLLIEFGNGSNLTYKGHTDGLRICLDKIQNKHPGMFS